MMKITKAITNFSPAFIPSYTGLLQQDLKVDRQAQVSKDFIKIIITDSFRLLGITDNSNFHVLTATTTFDIEVDNNKITVPEIRYLDELSLKTLKDHLNLFEIAAGLPPTNLELKNVEEEIAGYQSFCNWFAQQNP